MAEQVLDVFPPIVTIDAALGSVRDVDGNVIGDPVVSGSWTADDAAVGAIAAAGDGTLGAVVTLTEAAGTLNVSFAGTTESGAKVTGAAQVVVSVTSSGAVSVDVLLTPVTPVA